MTDATTKKASILVVDDDPTLRLLTRAALEQVGFDVIEAENGRVAVDVAMTAFPDMIMLDVEMPVLDGFSACAEIRKHKAFADTPVVMLTGRDDDESIQQAYDCGATDFISKPINWSLLGQRVRYIVRASRVSRGLRESESKNQAFVRAIPDSMLVVDADGRLLTHHRGASGSQMIDDRMQEGVCIYDVLPQSLSDLWRQQILKVLASKGVELSEHRAMKNRNSQYYESRVVPYTDDSVLIMLRDVTEQKQAAAKVRKLAFYDTLTGLPNRQSFLIQLAEAIREAENTERLVGVVYIDLDNFKLINDSLGHSVGDTLLKDIANRLSASVRRDDYIAGNDKACTLQLARLGGDEFTLLLRGLETIDQAEAVSERLVNVLKQPLECNGHRFVVTPSVGIAVYPEDGADLESLMKNADTALHHAKASGRDQVTRFSGTMSVRSLERLDIEDSLRRAIQNDDLELHFQPKLSLTDQRVTSVEALIRWTHPDRGPMLPDKFIPIAEDSGMIIELGDWVLQRACRQLEEWQSSPLHDVRIAINLSAKQFHIRDLAAQIINAIRARSLPQGLLDLELTEGALMSDLESTAYSLAELKEAGLSIAVDDFGTGYSSLSYLTRFPIDALKIDRSFVFGVDGSEESHSICKAIVALAHGLNMRVIAEGVETNEQLQLLRMMNCDEIQGYHFAKPMPASSVFEFIQKHRSRHVHKLPVANP